MADDRQAIDPSHGGVFGNLPQSRPGMRSPRRRPAGAEPEAEKAEPRRPAGASPSPRAAEAERDRRTAPPGTSPAGGQPDGANGLEDLAWAGVAAAAEAATIGVRLASRAIEALRGTTERR